MSIGKKASKALVTIILKLIFWSYVLVAAFSTYLFETEKLYGMQIIVWIPVVAVVGFKYWKVVSESFISIALTFIALGVLEILMAGGIYFAVSWMILLLVFVVKVIFDFVSAYLSYRKRLSNLSLQDRLDSIRPSFFGAEKNDFQTKKNKPKDSGSTFNPNDYMDIYGNPGNGNLYSGYDD